MSSSMLTCAPPATSQGGTVPFRSDPPGEDVSATQARGARIWLAELSAASSGKPCATPSTKS
jgi:hypothetical protein